jgi:hypothetical protein
MKRMIPVEWAMLAMFSMGAFGFIMGYMASERSTVRTEVDIYE